MGGGGEGRKVGGWVFKPSFLGWLLGFLGLFLRNKIVTIQFNSLFTQLKNRPQVNIVCMMGDIPPSCQKKIPPKKSHQKNLILPSLSCLFQISCHFFPPILFFHPFHPAQYIFPTYIKLLVPNLYMNLSLNLSKNDLKFHPGH